MMVRALVAAAAVNKARVDLRKNIFKGRRDRSDYVRVSEGSVRVWVSTEVQSIHVEAIYKELRELVYLADVRWQDKFPVE